MVPGLDPDPESYLQPYGNYGTGIRSSKKWTPLFKREFCDGEQRLRSIMSSSFFREGMSSLFASRDRDHDGKLTFEEFVGQE